jgi:hypothetical protein
MKKHVWIFGIIPGICWLVLQLFVIHQMYTNPDLETNDFLGFTAMILIFSLIFFGIRDYRNKKLGGIISFGKALKTGVLMALVATLVYVVVWMFYYHLLVPDFLDVYKQFVLDNEMMDPERIEGLMVWYKNPFGMILLTAFEVLPIALLVALISAAVLKKKKKVEANQDQ